MNIPNQHDFEIVSRVMTDDAEIALRTPLQNLWVLHLSLEVTRKHPTLHHLTKKAYRDIVRIVERSIAEFNPRLLWMMNSPLSHEQHRPADRTLLEDAMMSPEPLDILLSIPQLWLAVIALQLTARHPDVNGTFYEGTRRMADEMTVVLEEHHPGTAAIIAKGWDASWDQ